MVASHKRQRIAELDLSVPLALDPQNFTSLTRTPWAGQALATGIKRNYALTPTQKIGESWEVSCDPEAPSRLSLHSDITLADVISQRTADCLSERLWTAGRRNCDILIKLINADAPLSLQIHPTDDNKLLKPNECGKPESWLVLDAEDHGGIYLGFKRSIPVEEIKAQLENGAFSSDLLQFVPVKKGDYFEIQPHVPHAIGPGVVLLEPQRIIAGKSGKTWRLWDWNRRYNSAGDLDPINGTPRELHLAEALPLLAPESQSGRDYVDSLRRIPFTYRPSKGVTVDVFPANSWYQTILISMDPSSLLNFESEAHFGCLTVISGHVSTRGKFPTPIDVIQGQSHFIPAQSLPLELSTTDEKAHFTIIIPAGLGVDNRNHDELRGLFH